MSVDIETVETHEIKNYLPLLPLKNVVVLPKSVVPIIIGRQISISALEFALKEDRQLFITAQKDPRIETPTKDDVFTHGTRATIIEVRRMPNGALKILAEGICRARVVEFDEAQDFIGVHYEDLPTTSLEKTVELEAIWRQLESLYQSYTIFNDQAPTDVTAMIKTAQEMDYAADNIAIHISKLTFNDRQRILELPDLKHRMIELCSMLKKEVSILQTEQKVQSRIQNQVDKSHREYYLHEQMKAIRKELGKDDQAEEIDQIKEKISKEELPKEAREKVEKELARLEQMPPFSSEAVVSRNYIEWLTTIPWQKITKDTISIIQAERILNKNHAGLKKAKERIIEFLAAKKFSKNLSRSPVVCFVGPPGVGKTSLAKSIAQSLGREFVRISLGGVRDEAEIRGHRRTYIGALPGKIVQAMKKARVINPVILLDEIDKMSQDIHGDPAAALLEVLDPEQNQSFVDHFLDVGYDLSQVMFIATANVAENIPYPLLDRLELISLSGYTDEEKFVIAQNFLIPKNLHEYGLTKKQFRMPDTIINFLITQYTKEAGIRQLERIITKLMRKAIQEILKDKNKVITLTQDLVKEWLGNVTFKKTSLNTTAAERIGLVTGLAWTEVGGDVLEIEASVLPGKGTLTLTGQLGDVMQESAQAGLSYIRSRAQELGLKPSFHASKDIHIHIPEGATPKDGPSAGITIGTGLVSALTKIPTRHGIAMTGEITLQGRVLPIGGLKEKLLAAKQHNIHTVIVPHENMDDLEEIRKEIDLNHMQIICVKNMDEVLNAVFIENPLTQAQTKKQKIRTKSKKKTSVTLQE